MSSEANPKSPDIPKSNGAPADKDSREIGVAGSDDELIRLSYSSAFYFSGPIPPPKILAECEAAYPGAAATILKMAQTEQKNRWENRSEANRFISTRSMRGLGAGFLIAVLSVLCGTYCVIRDHDWAGTVICSGTLLGLVGLFVRGHADRDDGTKRAAPPVEQRGSNS